MAAKNISRRKNLSTWNKFSTISDLFSILILTEGRVRVILFRTFVLATTRMLMTFYPGTCEKGTRTNEICQFSPEKISSILSRRIGKSNFIDKIA